MRYMSILVAVLLLSGSVLADLPGGMNLYSGSFSVRDHNNNPLSGIAVKLTVRTYDIDDQLHTFYRNGTTDGSGSVYLECLVEEDLSVSLYSIEADMLNSDYSIIVSSGTYSHSSARIYPYYKIVYDLDKDLVYDPYEQQIAEKFSPVLHKHSYDKQPGLANAGDVFTHSSISVRAANYQGTVLYTGNAQQIHVHDGWSYDSFGTGQTWVEWKMNFPDVMQHHGAPIGNRPIYYHVYKDENYYYVQYWFFYLCNDLRDQTNYETWHEGDWEHVTLRLTKSGSYFTPNAINFYRHHGGNTVEPNNCWWSSSNSASYYGIIQGYHSSRTHIHIWVSANGHGSYNRFEPVYRAQATILEIGTEDYRDNLDYNPSGYDQYFEYDFLEKLGEINLSLQAHGYTWFAHYNSTISSKYWIAYIGKWGDFWYNSATNTPSPNSPPFGLEWKGFTYDTSNFGNNSEHHLLHAVDGDISWVSDDPSGD